MPSIAVDTPDRTMLREAHRVRALTPDEEGTGLTDLPLGGVLRVHALAWREERTALCHADAP